MVEINNKTDVQYVYYPKTQNSTGPYTLHIHSELSQKDWHFENVEDKASLHDYYKFLVDYSSVDDGEFNYFILENEEVMDTGLLRIGIGQANVVSYDTPNEVIQYDMYGAPTERYQHKSVSATSNGTYNVLPDEGYAALSEVDVYVNVPSQTINNKSLTKIFANDSVDIINRTEFGQKKWYVYHAAERPELPSGYTGFYPVTMSVGVDITSVYVSGYTDGVEATSGGSYQQGYDDGQAAQKAKLVATGVTENGIYSRPDGYSSFVVSVAQTGHTDQELLDAFNSGYTNGKTEGYNSGWTNGYNSGWSAGYISGYTDGSGQTPTTAATALTINVPSSITGSGQVSVVAEPSTAILNLVYTSSDPTIATVDNNGNITVNSGGTVTICVEDLNSGLVDCKTISVTKSTYITQHLTFRMITSGIVKWILSDTTVAVPKTIQYSLNGGEWTSITSNTGASAPSITVEAGDIIKFRGDNTKYGYGTNHNNRLVGTSEYEIEGNIMSLIDSTGFATATTLTENAVFQGIFGGVDVVSAQNLVLPATTLTEECYADMFSTSFKLTTAPTILPATTLARSCYANMFWNCPALTTTPVLPATVLAGGCYSYMFYDCGSLTTAPTLPATTMVNGCYEAMFAGCSSLTTAPELPATTLDVFCYLFMFENCTSLNYIKCLATDISANGCTYNWVQNVASLGTFVKDTNTTWGSGASGIPTNWTVVDAQ